MVTVDEKYAFPRDLVGYGQQGKDCKWPHGARIAVSICVNYEEGSESTILTGDAQSETANWEKHVPSQWNAVPPPRHTNAESDYEYGSRSGIWRLLRIFADFQFHFTCFAVGHALEQNPAVASACIAEGHELAGHGYRWLDYKDATPAVEKAAIKQCIAAITATTGGIAPKGWFAGRGSPNSVGVIWEAFRELGLPLCWESDAFNDDVPYWVDVPLEEAVGAQGLLMVPYAYDTNDMKVVAPAAFGGSDWEELLRRTFDMLYEEGGKVMSVGIHPRLTGKPGRARALQSFLQYISEKEGVWVATRAEIAEHFRAQNPYPGKSTK